MRTSLAMKTLFRAPVKAILTFILIGVVTFMLFSQAAEYTITTREMENAAQQYQGIGFAEIESPLNTDPTTSTYIKTDPRIVPYLAEGTIIHANMDQAEYYFNADEVRYKHLTQEQIDQIVSLPYITSYDKRYMTAGVSDTYTRMSDDTNSYNYYGYINYYVVEGTYTNRLASDDTYRELAFDDFKIISERPGWFDVVDITGENFVVSAYNTSVLDLSFGLIEGGLDGYEFNVGERYAMLCRGYAQQPTYDFLGAEWFSLATNSVSAINCQAIWSLKDAPENYLETEEYAELRELIEMLNRDKHTFDMVYTSDMDEITRFGDGRSTMASGRMLTKEDTENKVQVCVVSTEFAEQNGLGVGDKITMGLGTELFEQYKGLGAVAASIPRYSEELVPTELEIVGVYQDNDAPNAQHRRPNWSYSINTIFVPQSLLPVDESVLKEHTFAPSEFSFVVENAWDIEPFALELDVLEKALDLRFTFDDGGWIYISNSFRAAQTLSIIKIVVVSAAAVVAIGFAVYLFISRKRKEYAIMRALGTKSGASDRALIVPLMVVALISVAAGTAAAWAYTAKTISANSIITMLEGKTISTAMPVSLIAIAVGEAVLTFIFAAVQLGRIRKMPPLELLQNNGTVRRKTTKKTAQVPAEATTISAAMVKSVAMPDMSDVKRGKTGSMRFALRYVFRHIRRSGWKSALSMLLAAALFMAVGQFVSLRQQYIELCQNTPVTALLYNGPLLFDIPSFLTMEFIDSVYYESKAYGVNINYGDGTIIYATNNVPRFVEEECEITYADGFDNTCMSSLDGILLAGEGVMERFGLKPGDKVHLANSEKSSLLERDYREEKGLNPTDELSIDQKKEAVGKLEREFTLVGVVSTPSGNYDNALFTPGMIAAGTDSRSTGITNFNVEIKLDKAEIRLADYTRVEEMEKYCSGRAELSGANFKMDTNKLAGVVSVLGILDELYPAVIAAALMIGAFICCLIIIQSSKEAAIMRAQGTTKGKSRMLLSLEQIMLVIVGIVMGIVVLLISKGAGATLVQSLLFALVYCVVIVIATIVCSAVVTRRSILELLQTKE